MEFRGRRSQTEFGNQDNRVWERGRGEALRIGGLATRLGWSSKKISPPRFAALGLASITCRTTLPILNPANEIASLSRECHADSRYLQFVRHEVKGAG